MRELFVVNHESNPSSLVLRTEDNEEFFVDLTALDDKTRATLTAPQPEPAEKEEPKPAPQPAAVAARPKTDVLSMRPPEIQNRIRAGATVAELAESMGVAESRVEPFAHPVILERERIAELSKQAHPVREDGPAKLTIFEILATSFAARGHSLADATWDAYRVKGEPWTIRVTWKAGLSTNEALWTLKQSATSPDVLEARNTVAADLTDPDFVQPVRTLTSVGKRADTAGARRFEALDAREDSHDTAGETSSVSSLHDRNRSKAGDAGDGGGVTEPKKADANAEPGNTADGDQDFLQHPEPEAKPVKRRRKAVTPAWEDVLLGVRASTKRPRS
ncbi:DNA-binding protein [Corynebacterium phocae]|uniref:DNA-binding protein n=1 Tax=Corynebacterium phocae TaxID=161895 RepID=A0A1L7D4G7_9CORY|nr:septation protein SepH [Corynebacterium phocae]APT93028.1 DNA-binding protein [Corynebacterium phocae]KAA8722519.1 DUF3071 domain-containing protein [Corynebacterium phocae]